MPCTKLACVCPTLGKKLQCKNFEPSRNSVYASCVRFQEYRILCDKKVGRTYPCEGCEFHDKKDGPGRPNVSGIDWNDPVQRAAYKRAHRQ